jgi:hypothetical protein
LTPDPPPTVLHHRTTLRRARLIEANGPDPAYREPGTGLLPPTKAFSTVIPDGRACSTGTPETAARSKHALFPDEGGPAILEVSVPAWIMAILYADPISAGLARSGEIRFESQSGLFELRAGMAQSHETGNRTVTADNPITELLATPLSPDWTVEGLAEQLLSAIAARPTAESQEFIFDAEDSADQQPRRLLRPLLACLATMSAAESGTSTNLFGGCLLFKRAGPEGPVWILGQFENKPGTVRVAFRRSASPPENSEPKAPPTRGLPGSAQERSHSDEARVADTNPLTQPR